MLPQILLQKNGWLLLTETQHGPHQILLKIELTIVTVFIGNI